MTVSLLFCFDNISLFSMNIACFEGFLLLKATILAIYRSINHNLFIFI